MKKESIKLVPFVELPETDVRFRVERVGSGAVIALLKFDESFKPMIAWQGERVSMEESLELSQQIAEKQRHLFGDILKN